MQYIYDMEDTAVDMRTVFSFRFAFKLVRFKTWKMYEK